jgi:hypothetical protein
MITTGCASVGGTQNLKQEPALIKQDLVVSIEQCGLISK